jgi:N-acyl-D-aspartate/D-glutamate deacylase
MQGIGLDLASLIGHNTVRSQVMGRANRQATPEEISKMQELVEQGMRAGAVGCDGGIREFGVGLPHPRSYGTNARVLAEFVRNRNLLTLEDAIRKMTSLPARTMGFRDRGLVREGYAAGLVLVNGQPVVDNGKLTGTRSGRVLRHVVNP